MCHHRNQRLGLFIVDMDIVDVTGPSNARARGRTAGDGIEAKGGHHSDPCHSQHPDL
jgi:hypothetical protein